MFAETEMNLVNGLAALALGFGLLMLVAWVDRRYLQSYEEVRAAEEEASYAGRSARDASQNVTSVKAARPAKDVPHTRQPKRPQGLEVKSGGEGVKNKTGKDEPGEKAGAGRAAGKDVSWSELPTTVRQPAPARKARAEEQAVPTDPTKPSPAEPSQSRTSTAKPSQAKPEPAKPSQAKPEPAKPSQAKPEPAKPSQAKPSQAKPEPAKPSQAEPSPAKPSQAEPSPAQATSAPGPQPLPAKATRASKRRNSQEPARAKPAVPATSPHGHGNETSPLAEAGGPTLPKGARAALASILEVTPDPRNTIALTRDPTAEVRITKPTTKAASRKASGSAAPNPLHRRKRKPPPAIYEPPSQPPGSGDPGKGRARDLERSDPKGQETSEPLAVTGEHAKASHT